MSYQPPQPTSSVGVSIPPSHQYQQVGYQPQPAAAQGTGSNGAPSSAIMPSSFFGGITKNLTMIRVVMAGMVMCIACMMVLIGMAYNLPLQACDMVKPGLNVKHNYTEPLCLVCNGWTSPCSSVTLYGTKCYKDCYCYQRGSSYLDYNESCGDLTGWEKFNQAVGWIAVVGSVFAVIMLAVLLRLHQRRVAELRTTVPLSYVPIISTQ